MQTDSYTKIVLSLILLCLVVLLVHGFSGSSGSAEATDEELGAARGRYALQLFQLRRGRPILLRWDTTTGEVWGMRNLMGREAYWELFDREGPPDKEPPPREVEESADAPTPSDTEEGQAVAE